MPRKTKAEHREARLRLMTREADMAPITYWRKFTTLVRRHQDQTRPCVMERGSEFMTIHIEKAPDRQDASGTRCGKKKGRESTACAEERRSTPREGPHHPPSSPPSRSAFPWLCLN